MALLAVPAEEYIEIEYRDELRRDGKLEFLGGKPELIRLGEMDDVDMALMCHTTSEASEKQLCISGTNNGTLAKKIRFLGRAAHAGGAPHLGVNALNAASLALMAIHANRETFQERDTIRVHPIITKGGEAVSAVPADVRMETSSVGPPSTPLWTPTEKSTGRCGRERWPWAVRWRLPPSQAICPFARIKP